MPKDKRDVRPLPTRSRPQPVDGPAGAPLPPDATMEDAIVVLEKLRDTHDPGHSPAAVRARHRAAHLDALHRVLSGMLASRGARFAIEAVDQSLDARSGCSAWAQTGAIALRRLLTSVPETEYDVALAWCLEQHEAEPSTEGAAFFAFVLADDRPAAHALQPASVVEAATLSRTPPDPGRKSWLPGYLLPLLAEAPPSAVSAWLGYEDYHPFSDGHVGPAEAAATAVAAAAGYRASPQPALTLLLSLARGSEHGPIAATLLAVEERGVLLPLLPCLDEASVLEALDRAIAARPAAMSCECLAALARPRVPTAIRTRVLKAIARHGAPQLRDWAAGLDAAAVARLEALIGDAGDTAPIEAWPPVLRDPPWRAKRVPVPPELVLEIAPIPTPVAVGHLWEHDKTRWMPDGEIALVLHALEATSSVDVLIIAARIDAAEIAPHMARVQLRLSELRRYAMEWLQHHPHTAALRLIPDAVGPKGEAQQAAEHMLRLLRDEIPNGAAAIAAATGAYAAHEPRIVEALAASAWRDPLLLVPARAPKLPAWFAPTPQSKPVLRDGGTLPEEAVTRIAEMLSFSRPDATYAGIATLHAHCTPESLDAFVLELLTAWIAEGMPPKDDWAMQAVGSLGGEAAVDRLVELIRRWPSRRSGRRAREGMDVLTRLGSDAALRGLSRLAETLRDLFLQDDARKAILAIAEARGLSRAELDDRLVPDLGLDAQGGLDLDFGSRRFRVGFDEFLEPLVRDASGTRLRALPVPNKADDRAMAEAATARWTSMRKTVRKLAGPELRRFEEMLRASRRLRPQDFWTWFVRHPLARHVTQRLVWTVFDDAAPESPPGVSFRVAEDLSFADAADDPVTIDLAEDARCRIGPLHPMRARPGEMAAWEAAFAAHEIAIPFPIFARGSFALTEAEKAASVTERFVGQHVPTARLRGLAGRGFLLGPVEDEGKVYCFEARVATAAGADAMLRLQFGDGLGPGGDSWQTLGKLTIEADRTRRNAGPLRFGDLDPVRASEMLRAITLLDGTTKA